MSQKLAVTRVLPVELPAAAAEPVDYIFEQPPGEMLERLLPRYVEIGDLSRACWKRPRPSMPRA